MFLFILTYQKSLEEVEKYLEDHRAYLDKYYKAGKFIVSGRREPRIGGLTLFNAEDREEAELLMKEDPFYIHNIASYEIIEFIPTKYLDEFNKFLPNK